MMHKPFLTTLLITLIGLSCGVRKPPQPPTERVPQRVEISGEQIGPQVVLRWEMPARNAGAGKTMNISRANVYRLAEPLTSPLSLTEVEFDLASTLIASIPITDQDFGFKEMTYTDILQFATQPVRLRYAVKLENASGQKAGFSNFFLIEPTPRVAKKPVSPTAVLTQNAVNLSWEAPNENEDGTSPANIQGFNVYRLSDGKTNVQDAKKLNSVPVPATSFSDNSFEFDKSYTYFVRAVSLGTDALPVESLRSDEVRIEARDSFAPSPPSSLTIAAAPNSISLFFAQNIEPDVVSYKIYRTADQAESLDRWQLLTPTGIETTTFQDKRVQPGVRYFYYVTAIDKFGNTSGPSEIVSEKAF